MNQDITNRIKSLIATQLGLTVGSVSDQMTIEELGLDSLAFAEVVIAIEKAFARPIDTTAFVEEIGDNTRVADLIAMFTAALAEPAVA